MKTVFFTDLDDTLFATARKQAVSKTARLATTLADGTPSAYQNQQQQQLWQWLQTATVIPVTARNRDSFYRVRLPFSSFAVLNHGGTILMPDGTVFTAWQTQVETWAWQTADGLVEQCKQLQKIADEMRHAVRLCVQHEWEIPLYVLLKSATADDSAVAEIGRRWQTANQDNRIYTLHINANNLAILPAWLGKAQAVKFLQQHLHTTEGELLSIGIGDSTSDLPFMRCCHYWLTPSGSQIDKAFEWG